MLITAQKCVVELIYLRHLVPSQTNGVFTLAWSGTGKNGLYGFDKSLSHCTGTGTGTGTGKKSGCYTHLSGPENVPGPEY